MVNLAYGGAFTGVIDLPPTGSFSNYVSYVSYPNLQGLPGVAEEVAGLLANNPEGLNPNALYVVWAGSNDLFAALDNLDNSDLLLSILAAAPYNVANAVCDLSDAGAKHFIVANLPDIGLTPLADTQETSAYLTLLSAQFNQWLAEALAALPCAETLVVIDVFSFLRDVVDKPGKYGLTNVTTPCINLGQGANCSTYLFWDTVHPTTYGHSLIAERFRAEFCGTGNQHPGLRGRPNRQPPPIWRGACYGSK